MDAKGQTAQSALFYFFKHFSNASSRFVRLHLASAPRQTVVGKPVSACLPSPHGLPKRPTPEPTPANVHYAAALQHALDAISIYRRAIKKPPALACGGFLFDAALSDTPVRAFKGSQAGDLVVRCNLDGYAAAFRCWRLCWRWRVRCHHCRRGRHALASRYLFQAAVFC